MPIAAVTIQIPELCIDHSDVPVVKVLAHLRNSANMGFLPDGRHLGPIHLNRKWPYSRLCAPSRTR